MALVDDYVRENERIRHEIEEELALVRGGGEGHDLLQLENILTELNVIYSIPGQPLTYLEYITDIARLAHEAGLWNILVTAGYVCQEPLKDLLPYLDAANIDLKSFSDDIYMKVSGGHLQPVLDTILAMRDAGVWIELTNLLIPEVNDDRLMIREMSRWIVDNDLADHPLHFSRFFPRYKMEDVPPTPIHTLKEAKLIAIEEGIRYVYLGNV